MTARKITTYSGTIEVPSKATIHGVPLKAGDYIWITTPQGSILIQLAKKPRKARKRRVKP